VRDVHGLSSVFTAMSAKASGGGSSTQG
jgi:hypothetical protein